MYFSIGTKYNIMDSNLLAGKKALVVGIANEHSIAYGCASMLKAAGAELAITYLNEKAKTFIDPIAKELDPVIYTHCDVSRKEDLINLLQQLLKHGGKSILLYILLLLLPKKIYKDRWLIHPKRVFCW